MKCVLFLITLAVCLPACDHPRASLSSSSDAEIQKKLAGTWRRENGKWSCVVVVGSNGNYAAQSDSIRNVSEEGTWIIKDRKLISCLRSACFPAAVGEAQRWGL
jgi:hypothetical protein